MFLVVAKLASGQSTLSPNAVGSCYAGDCSANNVINAENALQQTVYGLALMVQQLKQTVTIQEIVVEQLQETVISLQSCCNSPPAGQPTTASQTPPPGSLYGKKIPIKVTKIMSFVGPRYDVQNNKKTEDTMTA